MTTSSTQSRVYLLSASGLFEVYELYDDNSTLKLLSSIDLELKSNALSFALCFGDKYAAFYDGERKQLCFYNLKGVLLEKIDVEKQAGIGESLSTRTSIIQHADYKNNFLLFDQANLKLYIF